MRAKTICPSCSNEVKYGDKFCSSCGTKLDWEQTPEITKQEVSSTQVNQDVPSTVNSSVCKFCGTIISDATEFCLSCGAKNPNVKFNAVSETNKTQQKVEGDKVTKLPPPRFTQSWKLTAVMAIIFIGAIVITRYTGKSPDPVMPTEVPQSHTEDDMEQLQQLQDAVAKNPNDLNTVLHFANKLQDLKFYSKAIAVYDQYIQLQPQDANARVDIGVTYFQLTLSDSMKHMEFLDSAAVNFSRALVLKPGHQLALYNMGIITLHKGEMESSREWFLKCAQVDSTTETGKKALLLINQHSFTNPS